MPAQPPLLEISNLSKTFGRLLALAHIHLSVSAGESFALLGLNGAGKTTLFRCLLGLLHPTEGRILFNGHPLTPADIHQHISYLPERFQPPPELSALELLSLLHRTTRAARSPAAGLEQVGLAARSHQRIRTYSQGMVQRLGLAVALLKTPQVLIIDEPFVGLDLAGQRQMVGVLQGFRDQGATLIFSSHLFVHLETCARRFGILHQGRLGFVGSAEELCGKHRVGSLEDAFCKEVDLRAAIKQTSAALGAGWRVQGEGERATEHDLHPPAFTLHRERPAVKVEAPRASPWGASMRPLVWLTWLKVLQGVRQHIFWGVGLFFLALLGLSLFLSLLSVGESDRVLRGAGLAAMEWSGLGLLLLSFTFGFYRDRTSRMTEVFLVHAPAPVHTASHLCAALALAFAYLILAGLCWSAVLALHQAFVWPLWAGVAAVFLKLALAISLNLLFCCVLSSPALAVLSTVFLYVAGALAPEAFKALALEIHHPLVLGMFKGLCYLLPNLGLLDLTAPLLAGQSPAPLSLVVMSGYTVLYCLLLWSAGTWAWLKQDSS